MAPVTQHPGVVSDLQPPIGAGKRPLRRLTRPIRGISDLFRRFNRRLSRALKLGLLVLVIAAVLVATAFLDRSSQLSLFKVFLVLFLSLIPGWLYLQFIEVKGRELYDEFVLNLYRLRIDEPGNLPKPPPGTPQWSDWNEALEQDVDPALNIYLRKFEAVYGRSAIPGPRRLRDRDGDEPVEVDGQGIAERIRVDAFFPIVLLTVLLCAGWSSVMVPELIGGVRIYSGPFSGLPRVPVDLLQYAFIGAYAFIIQNVVRRYFLYDLKSNAFVSGIVRIVIAASVVVALHPIFTTLNIGTDLQVTLAFLIGFFPDYGFRLAWQAVTTRLGGKDPTEQSFPLSEIDGLDIWSRGRLLEEGIEDMQNLATANLVDVMLNTRTPVNRLIDWIDQSFLYLRVTSGPDGGDRARLRRLGVRSATDLFDAFADDKAVDPEFRQRFLYCLNDDKQGPSVTEGLRRSLEGEVNLWHIRRWKERRWLADQQDR